MKGSIVAAAEGDREAARRAKQIGALLLRDATRGRYDGHHRQLPRLTGGPFR
jgi:hypothetical protein